MDFIELGKEGVHGHLLFVFGLEAGLDLLLLAEFFGGVIAGSALGVGDGDSSRVSISICEVDHSGGSLVGTVGGL